MSISDNAMKSEDMIIQRRGISKLLNYIWLYCIPNRNLRAFNVLYVLDTGTLKSNFHSY